MIHAVNRPGDQWMRANLKTKNQKQKPTDSISAKRNAIKKIRATPRSSFLQKLRNSYNKFCAHFAERFYVIRLGFHSDSYVWQRAAGRDSRYPDADRDWNGGGTRWARWVVAIKRSFVFFFLPPNPTGWNIQIYVAHTATLTGTESEKCMGANVTLNWCNKKSAYWANKASKAGQNEKLNTCETPATTIWNFILTDRSAHEHNDPKKNTKRVNRN